MYVSHISRFTFKREIMFKIILLLVLPLTVCGWCMIFISYNVSIVLLIMLLMPGAKTIKVDKYLLQNVQFYKWKQL
jgi:hypothetical protein